MNLYSVNLMKVIELLGYIDAWHNKTTASMFDMQLFFS